MKFDKYDNDSLVPYFFLNFFNKGKYVKELEELLNICNLIPTAKNLYIKSFL